MCRRPRGVGAGVPQPVLPSSFQASGSVPMSRAQRAAEAVPRSPSQLLLVQGNGVSAPVCARDQRVPSGRIVLPIAP